jgi:hypothetical protein
VSLIDVELTFEVTEKDTGNHVLYESALDGGLRFHATKTWRTEIKKL